MKYNDKVLLGFLIVFTILSFSACIIIIFADLEPSITYAKTYIPTECQVLNHYIVTEFTYDECIELNNDIWWYNKLGENDFYLYIVKKEHQGNIGPISTGSNNYNSFSSDSSSDSEGSDSILPPGGRKCYQGLYEVSYQLENGNNEISNISGVWNINQRWVYQYLNVFNIDSTSNCFYQKDNNLNVNWFGPAKYSIFSIVGISVGGGFTLFLLILLYFFYRKFSKNKKMGYISNQKFFHHQQYEETETTLRNKSILETLMV